jgi:hypothetical protein
MIEVGCRIEPDALKRLSGKLLKLGQALVNNSKAALKKVGAQYYEIVVSRMGEFTGGMAFVDVYWEPLSPAWLDEKRLHGWTEEIWEAEGLIKAGIKVYDVEAVNGGFKIFVGLKEDGIADSYDGKTKLEKALRNEFGLSIPARPLFGPAVREMAFNPAEKRKILEHFKVVAKNACFDVRK